MWWWIGGGAILFFITSFVSFGLGMDHGNDEARKDYKAKEDKAQAAAAAAISWMFCGQSQYKWIKSGTKDDVQIEYVKFYVEHGKPWHRKYVQVNGWASQEYTRSPLTNHTTFMTQVMPWLEGDILYGAAIQNPSKQLMDHAELYDDLKWDAAQKKWVPLLDKAVTSTELSKADTEDLVDLLSKVRDNESKESTT